MSINGWHGYQGESVGAFTGPGGVVVVVEVEAWGGLSYASSQSENQLIILRASSSLCRVLARGDSRQVISSSVTLFAQSDSHWNIVWVYQLDGSRVHRLLARYSSRIHPRHIILRFTVWIMHWGHEEKWSEFTPKYKRNSELNDRWKCAGSARCVCSTILWDKCSSCGVFCQLDQRGFNAHFLTNASRV